MGDGKAASSERSDTGARGALGAWIGRNGRIVLLYGALLFACALARFLPPEPGEPGARLQFHSDQSFAAVLDRLAFDMQARLLREIAPLAVVPDVALVGIDDGSTLAFPEPIALWHRHTSQTLIALAAARPAAVGVDTVLPERSFDAIMPGLDLAMFRGIKAMRQVAPVVFVRTVDSEGHQIPIHAAYERVLGEEGIGLDQQWEDTDFVARRFSERHIGIPTLTGQILRALGRPVDEGFIDYSVGGALDYVPMQKVIALQEAGDVAELRRLFEGRIVLIGSVWRHMDRWWLPAKIVAWEKGDDHYSLKQPGVIVHAQVLRSHFAGGLIHPSPDWLALLLGAVAAAVVFVRARMSFAVIAGVAIPSALVMLSLALIRQAHWLVPAGSLIVTLWTGLAARGVHDAVQSTVERLRLKRSFSGQVSPAVLEEIMSGGLAPGSNARLVEVCVIFSDIRGFTTLSESMPPETVMAVLQRYFDRMVKVVHQFDGTIDKFIGDGMMILFGAPRVLADPCGDGVRCALAMLDELDVLNSEFRAEGLAELVAGIGINYGKVVVGNIGSTERHNYSAIGDAVNVAARVEGLTKDVGRKVLITEAVVSRLGDRFHFEALGERLVKGHSPVKVWGIRTKAIGDGNAELGKASYETVNGERRVAAQS